MSFESTALLALAECDPPLAIDIMVAGLRDDLEDRPRRSSDSDLHGQGLAAYGPRLALDGGATPVERLEVIHGDYYQDVVTVSHHADGSRVVALHAVANGFGLARRPSGGGYAYEIVRLP